MRAARDRAIVGATGRTFVPNPPQPLRSLPIDTWQIGAASGVALLALIAVREVARAVPAGRPQRVARALVLPVALLFVLFMVISVIRALQILGGAA